MDNSTFPFQVGDWIVDPMSRQIINVGTKAVEIRMPKRIDPKPLAVLVSLAKKNGAVVSREELFDEVWEDAIVIEEALTRCISDLRKTFEETPRDPRIIETIRGVGYRLIPSVQWLERTPPESTILMMKDTVRTKRNRTLFYPVLVVAVFFAAFFFLRSDRPSAVGQPAYTIPSSIASGMERFASFAPNGRSIAYSVTQDGRSYTIQILDSVDAIPRELAHTFPENDGSSFLGPVWSSDSNRIGFLKKKGPECHIWIAEIDRIGLERVGDCEGNFHNDLAWSTDQNWFAFSSAPAGQLPQKIFLVASNDSQRFELTDGGGSHFGDHNPVFSPDGRKMAFIRTESEARSEVFVTDLESKEVRQLTDDHRVILGLDWIDENEIVFSSNRSGQFQLWRIPARTADDESSGKTGISEPIWVPSATDNAYNPTVSRPTKTVLYAHITTMSSILQWRDGVEQVIVTNAAQNSSPHLSPDENQLAYVSSSSGDTEIWTADTNGGNQRQITVLKSFVDGPRWSPDGRQIAFFGGPEGSLDLFVYHVDGGRVERVTSGLFDEIMPRWSLDGSRLYYASDQSGEWQIWYLDGSDFQAPPVPTGMPGLALAELSAAMGSGFYVASPESPGLVHFSADFERIGDIGADLSELDWGAWDVAEGGLFYLRRDAADAEVRFLRIGSPSINSQHVATLSNRSEWSIPWQAPVLDVSSEASSILFVRNMVAESELMLVGPVK